MEHKHHGKSSAKYLDADEILSDLNLKGNEIFLDAGCGDGYISKKALDKYISDGMVYAVDAYDVSVNELEKYKIENNIENLEVILADITEKIHNVDDESVDMVLMLNVFHGFNSEEKDDVICELKRIIKNNGRIAIMDFKAIEMDWGPPLDIRLSPNDIEKLFVKHGFKKTYLNENIGKTISNGKSHYLIVFEKE
ncbi:MAG: class I SAM-dependent methyltransferase [Methanobrevibacter thaueri]|nr:class I SAM-dependent methyltransferase [Methanobrevibacter thaueri]